MRSSGLAGHGNMGGPTREWIFCMYDTLIYLLSNSCHIKEALVYLWGRKEDSLRSTASCRTTDLCISIRCDSDLSRVAQICYVLVNISIGFLIVVRRNRPSDAFSEETPALLPKGMIVALLVT